MQGDIPRTFLPFIELIALAAFKTLANSTNANPRDLPALSYTTLTSLTVPKEPKAARRCSFGHKV